MEANEDRFLEELLSIERDSWEATPSEIDGFFTTSWGFDTFKPNPSPYDLPLIIPTSFECFSTSIKPELDFSLTELLGQFETPSFPSQEELSMTITEDNNVQSLELQAATSKVEIAEITEMPSFDMDLCLERKNKKKQGGQPSKNLMAERRRRKRLNDRLSMLRSVVPKISKMDRTSILGDTIDYMKELLEKINNMQEQSNVNSSEMNGMRIISDQKQDHVFGRTSAKFDVERRKVDTLVKISCAGKPGLLLSTISTLEGLGLGIQQCVISCFNDFSLHASCSEELDMGTQVSSEDIKHELFRNAGYGGSCL